MLIFKEIHIQEVETLKKVCIQTFTEAFAHLNTAKNLNDYLDKAFSVEALSQEIINPESTFFFVYNEEHICGYFKINVGESQTELKEVNGLELERIYISTEYQGKRIGEKVIEEVKKIAIQLAKKYIWLGVWELNKNAIRFYERVGFKKFDTHIYPIGDDPQLDWMMRLEI